MASQFEWRHIPVLLVAAINATGILWPIANPRTSIIAFGFPAHIAQSPAAAPVMMVAQVRTTTIGLIMFALYFKGYYESVDIVLAVFGTFSGVVDSYTVWKYGKTRRALYRVVRSTIGAACGFAGITAGW
ncbi:hypothetical protein F4777DRAFT_601157 [Nemania sp. FL0916]|nr:hypothetical protein F4777DRAFT_601157 [Nemania sp. FL0916]